MSREPQPAATARLPAEPASIARFPLDGAVVPGLLLLIARDLAWHDPPRVLGWRLLHDPEWADALGLFELLAPRPAGAVDSDPVAFALASGAVLLAALYLLAAAARASERVRQGIIAAATLLIVVAPTLAFVGLGHATGRPYGQDGGVVQLPLAIDELLAGSSPWARDYSDTVLGKQSRASAFWEEWGGNPILSHHAYLPGTHLLMLPFHVASRALLGGFDPRLVTLLAFGLAGLLAARGLATAPQRLTALACVWLNPLVYWHQIFGANDILFVLVLLGAVRLAESGRTRPAAAMLGLACATKQLAWPFAPFLLLYLSGLRAPADLLRPAGLRALLGPCLLTAGVALLVIAPGALLDPAAFWDDIVAYNVGLPGGDNYPLGGTPGFGIANLLLYTGRVTDLAAYFPFGVFYVLLLPLGLLMARVQLKERSTALVFLLGSTALVASVYLSRVAHPNYLLPAAILVPLALLRGARRADVGVVPLLLFAVAFEIAEREPLRALWEQAAGLRWAEHLTGWAASLGPQAGGHVTRDPFGLGLSALVAGVGVVVLIAGALGAPHRVRLGLVGLGVAVATLLPLWLVASVGERTGIARAQDAWLARAAEDGARVGRSGRPAIVREAWSTSFRLEPPRVLEAGEAPVSPGSALLVAPWRGRDARGLLGLALLVVAGLGGILVLGEAAPLVVGVLALASPLGLGGVFGHGGVLAMAGLLGAIAAARAGRDRLAGALAGLAASLATAVWWVLPLGLGASMGRSRRSRTALGFGFAFGVMVLSGVAAGSPLVAPAVGDRVGVGIDGLLLYCGLEALWTPAVGFLASAIATLALIGVARRRGLSPLAAAAVVAAVTLWLTPDASPDAVGLPMALAVLAASERG